MSSQINKSARKDNKYIVDMDTTRPSLVENLPKQSLLDRNTQGLSKIDGGPSYITDNITMPGDSTFRDISKFTTDRPGENTALKNILNNNFRTLTPLD
jgi:hypothetical protein